MKYLIQITLILALGMVLIQCGNSSKETSKKGVRHVDALEALALIKNHPEITVIDVRTPGEYADGNISGSRNIDVKSAQFTQDIQKLDPSDEYLIYCRSGNRSQKAVSILQENGFNNLIHLDGGYLSVQELNNAK